MRSHRRQEGASAGVIHILHAVCHFVLFCFLQPTQALVILFAFLTLDITMANDRPMKKRSLKKWPGGGDTRL